MASRESREEDSSGALERVRAELEKISSKIDRILDMNKKILQHFSGTKGVQREVSVPELGDALDVMTLLSLPDHLRKSAMVICRVNKATADEVAEETKRARAVESSYLNQLVNMGHLKKRRKGRKVYFYIEK